MITKKIRKLAASVLLAMSVVGVASAATTMQVNIAIDEISPLYSSTTANLGSVTYDEGELTNVGLETLRGSDASFLLHFDGFSYIASDDIVGSAGNFPEFYFTDGVLVGLGFEAPLKSVSASAGSYLLIENGDVHYSYDGGEAFKAHLVVTSVPEPSSGLLVVVSGVMLLSRRRGNE